MITSAEGIRQAAKELTQATGLKRAVIAGSERPEILTAARAFYDERLAQPILVGDAEVIQRTADENELDISPFEVIHAQDEHDVAFRAAALANEGQADVLVKGYIKTATVLRGVLSRKLNLRTERPVSHVAIVNVPTYPRLLGITDGGAILEPDLEQKLGVIANATIVARALQIERPRMALLSAEDCVYRDRPDTMYNAIIAKMGERGQLGDILIEGPITLGAALDPEIAAQAGLSGPVAGQADFLIVNGLEEGNIIGKSFSLFTGAESIGVVVGAKVPISLVSRTDNTQSRVTSLSLTILMSQVMKIASQEQEVRPC